jgi:uncharacterized protein
MNAPRPYANPYVAGVGLGLVLLACFVTTGRGLGASGAFASASASLAAQLAPEAANANDYFRGYLDAGGFSGNWLVFELLGVLLGAAASAWLAGRWRASVDRGPRLAIRSRLRFAAGGGVLMGIGAMLARGCTSGQALSGGALLSVGSWIFMLSLFASAYLVAPLLRRLWR